MAPHPAQITPIPLHHSNTRNAMKRTNILYWTFTGLFAAAMLFSSVGNILVMKEAVEYFKMIQMPAYLLPFLGWARHSVLSPFWCRATPA